MKLHHVVAPALLLRAAPAAAERLVFDYRLYHPLQRVVDGGDKEMVDFNAQNPARVVDLIAVRGTSAHNWAEALEIVSIARPRTKGVTVKDWMGDLQKQALAACPSTFAVLAEDANSVTFEQKSPGCTTGRGATALYRLVAGKRSWFALGALSKGELDTAARGQWLALLASAHLSD